MDFQYLFNPFRTFRSQTAKQSTSIVGEGLRKKPMANFKSIPKMKGCGLTKSNNIKMIF
jgi:hypothetical protein